MSVVSTVLIFVIIPVVLIGVIVGLTLAGGPSKGHPQRYRPGRPFDFQPVWFLSSPEQVTGPHAQIGAGHGGPADNRTPVLEAAPAEGRAGHRALPGRVGGASDRW